MAIQKSTHIQIPVIDISVADSDLQIAEGLVQAATTHGFVYIKNQGADIPVQDVETAFALSGKFFASPKQEKEPCTITEDVCDFRNSLAQKLTKCSKNKGWSSMHSETLSKTQRIGDFKEAFNFGEFSGGRAQQQLPLSLSSDEAVISKFFDQCHNLCLKLLKLFALGLHVDPEKGGSEWFSSRHSRELGPSGCVLRYLFYPSIPEDADYNPEVDIRAGAHSDYGSITLLFQRPGQPGLEILTADGNWAPVPVSPPNTEEDPSPPILVNIGDLLSHWTNGLLRSTVHRVIFPKEAKRGGENRYSIAFFCHPFNGALLEQVPSELVRSRKADSKQDGNAAVEKVITAEEHLLERLRDTYLSLKWDKKEESAEAK